jgi:cell division protein FtsB
LTRPEEPARDSFRPILGAAVLLFVAVLAMAGTKSYRDLEAARQHKHLLETRIQETQGEIARLRGRIERLRSDPGTLERLAREDLGMVRPGDVVIELPQDPLPPKPGTILPSPAVSAALPSTASTGSAPKPPAATPAVLKPTPPALPAQAPPAAPPGHP